MQDKIQIALIQTYLFWENPEQNRINIEKHISAIKRPVDLIVLPEMFTSGFTMNANSVAESMTGKTITWLINLANKVQAAIIGSLVISENNNYYNRLVCVEPSGNIKYYDKKHAFTLAGEHNTYTSGKEKLIFNYKGWKICPLICMGIKKKYTKRINIKKV